jgi:hypothetical protein
VDHVGLETLNGSLQEIRRSPADRGLIELIVRRPEIEQREMLAEATIDQALGLVGDLAEKLL